MDKNLNFQTVDKEEVVKFLNLIAKHAKFNFDTQEVIAFYKALSYMQTQLLPKIEANLLEVVKVVDKEDIPEVPEE